MTKAQILVVEDEHVVAEDIKESLQILGYAVSAIAYSKDEAVEKAQETNPDLVLMDIVLKGETSGLEAAGIIRSRFDIPVVYLTAYADEKTLERAKITEAFGYIIKPFKDRELHTAIEMALYKHKMERRLKEREEWLSTTLASIGDAVIATDMKGRIIFMNPVARFLTGCEQEDATGIPLKEIFKIVNEKTRKPVEDPVEKVLSEGIIVGLANHTILIAKDETERPIDDSGAPIRDDKGNVMGVVLVFRDVSERRKTEHALRQSEERYRTLFEDSRDAIYITAREGMFVDANQSMLDLFGYSREEMIGLNARKIYVNSDDRNIFQKEIEQTGSVKEYEVKFCKKDGTKMDCLLTSSVRQDDDGSILGYQGVIHDITERKCIEAQLHQAQKLESIGTLAGGIAHDFNNLLMGIQGHASLISLDIDPHHPNFQHLNGIEAAVENGANLTRQLLGFARGGKYQTKVIDLNKLIQINSEMFGRTKKEINIHTKYQKDLWPVEVDPGQINQVMLNLYINAWQAMSRRGDLHIETSNLVINKNDAKSFKVKAGNYVKISVTDTGAGMDKATLQRIFDPFYTTKVMGRGTGLGLASAYGIIKNHGGIINVYSEKGSGATFEIFLLASEKQVIIEEKPAAEILMGTQTILLVDDEDMILDVGEEMLRKLGYTVMLAKSGNEAIKVYKKHKDEIDLIILDMIMPDISGSEAYDIMKEINPKIKVLLSSGYSVNGEAKEILERGCDGFIQKPFNLTTLSRKIGEILDLS
ncbi:MAG: PAS domain S-box protein [Deltaproteobacteria bacterium]|nr:PAS domain S-box protein [Deltaproteobacteria bacterium]